MEAPGDLRSKLMGQQVSLNLEQTNHDNIFQNPQSDWAVLKTVLFYSVLILVLPIGSFFATKSLLFEWFLGQVGDFKSYVGLLQFRMEYCVKYYVLKYCAQLVHSADGDHRDKHCVGCCCRHCPSPCPGALHLQGA